MMKWNHFVPYRAAAIACLFSGTALAQMTPTADAPGQGAQAVPGSSGDADPESIVDALFAVSGNHRRVRASGAKGVCVKGAFTPAPEAPSLSKAPHFTRTVPMTARFSMGGGNPNISDKTKPATRGFAMEFNDPSGAMVFYFISAPVFSTKTPRQLLDFVMARMPGPDGKPNSEKINAFAAANPETTRQAAWLNARPVPASFAGVDYWGVQAYTLTNGKGDATIAKLKAVAAAGQLGLSGRDDFGLSHHHKILVGNDRIHGSVTQPCLATSLREGIHGDEEGKKCKEVPHCL